MLRTSRTVPRPRPRPRHRHRHRPRRRAAPEARSGRAPSAARPWPADRAKPLLIRQQVSQGSVRTFAALYRLRRRRAQSRKLRDCQRPAMSFRQNQNPTHTE